MFNTSINNINIEIENPDNHDRGSEPDHGSELDVELIISNFPAAADPPDWNSLMRGF